jgi:glycosyltransferase involved in cell wall biosynthesis
VVDDGSTDLTEYALSQFGSAIRVIRNEGNVGLPTSLNSGIMAASGNYIARVDADDYVNAHFLQFLTEYLLHAEGMDAAACDYYLVDENEGILEMVSSEQTPIGCGILFRKEDMLKVGLYNPSFLAHEDKEFRKRFDAMFAVGHIPIPLYRYRRHSGNMTNNLQLMENFASKLGE